MITLINSVTLQLTTTLVTKFLSFFFNIITVLKQADLRYLRITQNLINMFSAKSIGKSVLLFGAMALVIVGCSKDDKDPIVEDQTLSKTEVKTILESDDYAKSFDTIISEVHFNDSSSGKSNDCYVTTYTDTGFSIAFENCTVEGTSNVNGTLSAVYTSEGDTISYMVTWDDFSFGDITLNGTRSYSLGSSMQEGSIEFTVTSDMTVKLADDSVISETGTKEVGITFGDSFENTVYTLGGNWTVSANGNTYKVIVNTTLEGNLACEYLVEGIMTVEKNGLVMGVDLGDGECDDVATLEYPDGTKEEISLKD